MSDVALSESIPLTPRRSKLLWWRNVMLVMIPLHLIWTGATIGIRPEHWLTDALLLGLALMPGWPRRLSYRCIPFWFSAVLYENFRHIKHWRGAVHVGDLFAAELSWFGVNVSGTNGTERIIWPEYFRRNPSPVLDLLCGFAYLAYLYETVALGFYLFYKDEKRMGWLAWGFLIANVFGMIGYLVYPAAPPWYVELYGLGAAVLTAKPNPAGAARFDELLGINYFTKFYSRSPVVFGAMPSLHVAYPVLAFCVMASKSATWAVSTFVFAVWVAFSAVYLRHHYVFDVAFGALVGFGAFGIVRGLNVLKARKQAEGKDAPCASR